MKIAVGTKNKAKLKAVEMWAEKEFEKGFEIVGVSVESGISDMPLSDEECILGASNRAKLSIEMSDADFGIGLEGGVSTKEGQMFLCGWVAITDKNGALGIGSGGHIMVPEFIAEKINAGEELGPIMHEIHDRDVRNFEGAVGVFTEGRVSRSQSFVRALDNAYGKITNKLYE